MPPITNCPMPSSSERGGMIPGKKVFFVEDETLVAFNLEDILHDLGCIVVGSAMRVDKALAQIATDLAIDVAILDVNIAGELVFPVAERLAELDVPIVFATGYNRDGLPARWHDRTILQKPYTQTDIERAIAAAIGG
jgi:two-component SAPR family response regulator